MAVAAPRLAGAPGLHLRRRLLSCPPGSSSIPVGRWQAYVSLPSFP